MAGPDGIGRRWPQLMRKLGLTTQEIDSVRDANPRNMQEQIRRSLELWCGKKRETASKKVLLKVLNDMKLVKLAKLVDNAT